jgi:flagellar L-ring protein precursor FlgH
MKRLAYLLAIPVLAVVTGCTTVQPIVHDPSYEPTPPVEPAPQASGNGAIYQAAEEPRKGMSLFEDKKARRVGDILTIVLQENTSASKQATTTTSKDQQIDFPSPTIFGGSVTHNGKNILENSVDQSRDFSGDGESSQSNTLTGNITVTVAAVQANGNLVVKGEKVLSLNQGDEYIRFAGIVRPADIQPDNTVLSTQVANVQVTYGGSGVVADSNRMGWLARFFNSVLWPF